MGAACARRAPVEPAVGPTFVANQTVTVQLSSAHAEPPVLAQPSGARTVPVTAQPDGAHTGEQVRGRYVYQGLPVPAAVRWLPRGTTTGLPLLRFQRVVKRIRNILALRRLWSAFGAWLNVNSSRGHRSRRNVAWTFAFLGRAVVRKHAELFSHLVRRSGRLQYKDTYLERASRRRHRG